MINSVKKAWEELFKIFLNRKNIGQREGVIFSGFKTSIEGAIFLYDNKRSVNAMALLRTAYESLLWYKALEKTYGNEEKYKELMNCFDYYDAWDLHEDYGEVYSRLSLDVIKDILECMDQHKEMKEISDILKQQDKKFLYKYLCRFSHLSLEHTNYKKENGYHEIDLYEPKILSENDDKMFIIISLMIIKVFEGYSNIFEML